MSEKMVRTQVYLPQNIYEQIKERAEREGITMAHQIREALATYIVDVDDEARQYRIEDDDPIWDLIGIGHSGHADGSVNHNKYIYRRDWEAEEEA